MPKVNDEEVKTTFQNVIDLLENMLMDRSVPRNIKRVAQKAINELQGNTGETPGVIASNVMYNIDDLSQDPNCPFHSRTMLYRILSLLENIKD
ncbi:MAG: UPF0147 family protein [Promethearchaeota archaeon]